MPLSSICPVVASPSTARSMLLRDHDDTTPLAEVVQTRVVTSPSSPRPGRVTVVRWFSWSLPARLVQPMDCHEVVSDPAGTSPPTSREP